jgi:AcrR family transcriptional regulator
MGVVGQDVKRRSYDNTGRRAESLATRQRIIDATRQLMLERGYRATTVAAIARAAGVHVDTVYELVGRKPVLVRELIEQALSGTDHAVPAEDRPYVAAIRAEPDPRRKIALYAAAVRAMQARLAPLVLAVRDASATEPEAREVWRQLSDRRATNMRTFVRDLQAAGGLREGLSIEEAADSVWATNSSDMYLLLTVDRGWSPDRYERWLTDTWHRLLLPTRP